MRLQSVRYLGLSVGLRTACSVSSEGKYIFIVEDAGNDGGRYSTSSASNRLSSMSDECMWRMRGCSGA